MPFQGIQTSRVLDNSVRQFLVQLRYIVVPFCLVEVASDGITEVVFFSKVSGLPAGSSLGGHAHFRLITCQLPRLLVNCVCVCVCVCVHTHCIKGTYKWRISCKKSHLLNCKAT